MRSGSARTGTRPPSRWPGAGGQQEGCLLPLGMSADGKGVAMRPEARRRTGKAPDERVRTFAKRAGTGEKKGCKRMAETGCVFDVVPPDGPPRTPEQVMGLAPGLAGDGPRSVNRWYTCDITVSRAETIGTLLVQAGRRDPGHARPWIALVDGDNHQIDVLRAEAARQDVTITIVIDFIHVLEYLWKAAWCFHPPRDPAMEDWVTAQGLDILHGRAGEVIARIAQLAAGHPPRPGGEHEKIIRKTLHYLAAKQPYLDYPARPGERLAHRHRRHRGRLPPPRPGPDGHHRRQMGPARRPVHALAPRHRRQRRPRRLLGLAHHPGKPPQPPHPLPGPRQPRTRRITLTPKELHPCHIHVVSGTGQARRAGTGSTTGTTRTAAGPLTAEEPRPWSKLRAAC